MGEGKQQSGRLNAAVKAVEKAAKLLPGALSHVVLEVGSSLDAHPLVTHNTKAEGSRAMPRTLHCGLVSTAAAAAGAAVAAKRQEPLDGNQLASISMITVHCAAEGQPHVFMRHTVQRTADGDWECVSLPAARP